MVSDTARNLSPSEAATKLGVSPKALRIYEQRGLIEPARTDSGWRVYGPDDMARAAKIVAFRALGLGLSQVKQVLDGDPQCLEPALAAHQAKLESRARELIDLAVAVEAARRELPRGPAPPRDAFLGVGGDSAGISCAFDLPWPWGGERFELRGIRTINYIVGPLGCGKTQLARRIADTLPDAVYVGPERAADEGMAVRADMASDPVLASRVERGLDRLIEKGAVPSPDLLAVLAAIETVKAAAVVIDMVEQGLDELTQTSLIAYIRQHRPDSPKLFLMTRSSAILSMADVGADESVIFCPANHSPPSLVLPYPGSPGYEAVESCLALPEVRARTAGVIAVRQEVA